MHENSKDSPRFPLSHTVSTTTVVALCIVALQVVLSIGVYAFLPARIPIHWNIAGHIDSYAPKNVGVFILPVVAIGVFLLFYFLLLARTFSFEDSEKGERTRRLSMHFMIAVLIFLLLIQCVILAIASGINLDVRFIIGLLVSSLYIYVGNSLGKLQRNYWAGIRTPWALANDTVWERTHRLGGWLFVAAGIIGIICSFIPAIGIWGVVVSIFFVVVILYIYSYVTYQNLQKRGEAF